MPAGAPADAGASPRSPVHSARKLPAVRGQEDEKSSKLKRAGAAAPIEISNQTKQGPVTADAGAGAAIAGAGPTACAAVGCGAAAARANAGGAAAAAAGDCEATLSTNVGDAVEVAAGDSNASAGAGVGAAMEAAGAVACGEAAGRREESGTGLHSLAVAPTSEAAREGAGTPMPAPVDTGALPKSPFLNSRAVDAEANAPLPKTLPAGACWAAGLSDDTLAGAGAGSGCAGAPKLLKSPPAGPAAGVILPKGPFEGTGAPAALP